MAVNPSKKDEALKSPVDRANNLNDPQFSERQGYFPYDLTHQEMVTPRFGEVTPTCFLHTVPGDRVVHHDNLKTVHTQINGNFLNTVNQYVDSVFVPMRTYFPTNYEKLIPNPTKGVDLPNMALPQFPISAFIHDYIDGETSISFGSFSLSIGNIMHGAATGNQIYPLRIGRWITLATVLSRGQLLDYLGCSFDYLGINNNASRTSDLQYAIDNFFRILYSEWLEQNEENGFGVVSGFDLDMRSDRFQNTGGISISVPISSSSSDSSADTLAQFRSAISDVLEKGFMPYPILTDFVAVDSVIGDLYDIVNSIFPWTPPSDFETSINTSSDPFEFGFINIEKPIAYQLAISQYFTRDSVDNIFNADLFIQNLRSVMYPSDEDGYTYEPTFKYNGVSTEYDYISVGGLYHSLISDKIPGKYARQMRWMTMVLFLRRSLRYGDYFSTARPNMLAVGQLSIPVGDGNTVSPIDVTKNLLMQRYLNAVNYIGSGFLQYFASIYGVTPSDTACIPRFVSHRQIPLANDITTNTADNQGNQTTNLVGYSDNMAYDVFIDDIGVLLSMTSFDVLPVYPSGIDATYHFADRFDYLNPMLQNIGDQSIRKSELVGMPNARRLPFGYTMRNAEYKYKVSRAHGAFVNSLPGFLLKFPLHVFDLEHIDPDFIRDKPYYFDSICPRMSGVSPGEYFHFIMAVTNGLQCARKIQSTPPVLF